MNYVQTTKGFPSFQDVSPDFWGYFDLIEAYVGHNYIVTDDGTEVWTLRNSGGINRKSKFYLSTLGLSFTT